jgi:hypothetical protein
MAAVPIAFNVAALEQLAAVADHSGRRRGLLRAGRRTRERSAAAFVRGLPDRLQGAYFLSNGFPECVEMNLGQPAGRMHVVGGSTESVPLTARRFVWNQDYGRLEEGR